jgi:hypothetical protein
VGHILRRARVVKTVIPLVRPVIELVGSTDVNYVSIQRVCPAECARLPGVQRIGLAVARRLASAFADVSELSWLSQLCAWAFLPYIS